MDRAQQRKITRNREFRACTSCRKSKLKCDRQLPCSACTRRNEAESCFYERKFDGSDNERSRRLQAEAKLEHLEQLVQQLSQTPQIFTAPDITDQNANQPIIYQISQESVHNGATHWSAMLEGIEDLRATMNAPDEIQAGEVNFDGEPDEGMGLLFSAASPFPFEQILSDFLPPKNETDRLVAAYFRAKAVAAPFIHSNQFSRVYRLFWNDPSTASPLWTSVLFSILDIASRTISTSHSVFGERRSNQFSAAAAHCLAVGQYYKPQKFAVEALLLYAQARCMLSVDISPDLAVVFGALVRLATIMGYHRDAGSREDISAFDAEIRRRTWSLCMQLDLLVSFQLGLPSNVQFPTWDTKPPTNLLDADFDEDTAQLPLARPFLEHTEIVFYIAKHKIMAVFEKILRHTLSPLGRSTYDLDVIDAELRSTYKDTPTIFRPQFMADSIVDTPSLTVTRLCVNALYQKCICVLHRRYVMEGRADSIQSCYDASTDLVRRLVDMYPEFEPGGQLETERWFRGSITWHDFLLGCMALCLTVCSTKHHIDGHPPVDIVDVTASLDLLSSAKAVIEQHRTSRDSRKVRRLIEAVISSFGTQDIGFTNIIRTSPNRFQDLEPNLQPHVVTAAHENNDWPWDDTTMIAMEDPAWAYMQQFLDLPDGTAEY
ncbi:hypothetical protein N431DRAFT_352125 [Stipitochalara longipes BDJ]|nr:hypothetical protein N431DRAFT_352125 [Stipitochalara longipes BDJ]